MIALLLSVLIFAPTIAIVGINPHLKMAIGKEHTLTSHVNATLWSTYASFGTPFILGLLILGAVCLLCLMYLMTPTKHPKMRELEK